MRVKLSRYGFQLRDRAGSAVRHPWHALLPLVVTPLLFAVCFALAINRNVNLARLLRNSPAEAATLYKEFGRTSVENLLALQPPPHTSPLSTLQLFVPQNTLEQMHVASLTGDRDLGHDPGGDRPYHRAYYRDESGKLQKAKIAYRGLMHYHHWPDKPSLRVKITKSQIALGRRYVELSRPKDVLALRNQIPEVLAQELGLVSTINDQVRLFVNNKFFGVYLRSFRPGESLALANGRMPGTFFKGDLVAQDDRYDHLDLWESSKHWKLFGEAATADVGLFDEFLATLRRRPSAASTQRLAQLLDTQRLAKWAAVMIATGCVHTDARHNQTYFYCSNQGKFEIMPWDPTLYEVPDRDFTPVDTVNHPVLDRMIRDPRWVHRRNLILHELLEGMASSPAMHRHIDEVLDRVIRDLKADTHLSRKATIGRGRVPNSIWDIDDEVALLKAWAVNKEAFLRAYLNDARVFVEPAPDDRGRSRVHVFGHAAVDVAGHNGSRPTLWDAVGGEVERLYPGLSEQLHEASFKPHHVEKKLPFVVPASLVYTVDASRGNLVFHNAVTGERVEPVETKAITAGAVRTLSPSAFAAEPSGDIVLGPGEIILTDDLFIGRRQTLVLQPGTSLRLGEGIGIYSRGRVVAEGTPEAPISIGPFAEAPWAAFGVSGAGAAGSRFEHLRVAGGSIGSDVGVRFKGMFNVYDAGNVALRHCQFGANHVGDDAVNLAESTVRVEDCTFTNARADGLDLDMCTGTVSRCRWIRCGNDGLDMMGCRVNVEECEFESSGDKGISVGENSEALIRRCHIRDCLIGMQVKDASRIAVVDTLFEGNRLGYHSYQKKWLYPRGGSALLVDCTFRNSREATLGLEARSKAWLLRTPVDVIREGRNRVQSVTSVEPEWAALIERLELL